MISVEMSRSGTLLGTSVSPVSAKGITLSLGTQSQFIHHIAEYASRMPVVLVGRLLDVPECVLSLRIAILVAWTAATQRTLPLHQ
jgi:hypothetical protein